MVQPLSSMTMMLVKMSLQCIDFCSYSPSILVLAALYASTAFVKHSKTYRGDYTNRFCQNVRRIIFEILQEDLINQQKVLADKQASQPQLRPEHVANYLSQHSQQFVEQVAMDLVDFFKVFDQWHPGLNQLKKFNKIPFE